MRAQAKKHLVSLFYFLQGLFNVWFGLFFVRVDVAPGGSGGFAAGMEIMMKSSLLFASVLSFALVLALYFEFEMASMFCGVVSSLISGLFWGFIGLVLSWVIRSQFSLWTFFWFSLSLGIIVLNLVAVVFLIKVVRDM